jgi:hypothetical protein
MRVLAPKDCNDERIKIKIRKTLGLASGRENIVRTATAHVRKSESMA